MTSPADAQTSQQETIPAWETELIQRHTNQQDSTRRLAKQYGWPVRKNYSNQRTLQLQGVDTFGQPVYYSLHNSEAAQGTRTQSLYKGGSSGVALSGNSAAVAGRLGLWDGGQVLTTHQEISGSTPGISRVVNKDLSATISDHATHLAGTLVAGGVRAEAKGMDYEAVLSVWDYTNDIAELTAAASTLLVSNHAYGPVVGWVYNPSRPGTDPALKWEWWGNTTISSTEDYLFGFYTNNARDLDRVAYNSPFYLMVRSADNKRSETGPPPNTPYFLKDTNQQSTVARRRNDAYDVIPGEATAKNVLTVGAAEITVNDQQHLTSLETAPYSGWGPTDDGRIKPDLLGMGTNIFSTLGSDNAAYGSNSGTSMASANVAGSLFLWQELYAQKRAKTGTISAVNQFMRAATLRALAIHTADRLYPAIGPDYRQGWGLLNSEAAARVILNPDQAHLILEQTLASAGTFTYQLVAQGNEPLVVTLCWTDPEGTATPVAATSVNSRTPKLVNDLDLRMIDSQGSILPFVLDPSRPDQPATRGDNRFDNVEQVFIERPVPGQAYTLRVTHKARMTYAGQPFSLIVSGLRRSICQLSSTITPAGDTRICAGKPLILQAENGPGMQYEWLRNGAVIPGINRYTYSVTQAGRYAVRLTDANGCTALSNETTVGITQVDSITLQPEKTNLVLLQGAVVTLKAPDIADQRYQWYRDNAPIINANQNRFSVSQPGVYKVQVTQYNCVSWSSERAIRMSVLTATTPDPYPLLTLFPNPVEHVLSIRYLNATTKRVLIDIIDIRGASPQSFTLKPVNGQLNAELPVSDLPPGPYFFQMTDGEIVERRRFVKK